MLVVVDFPFLGGLTRDPRWDSRPDSDRLNGEHQDERHEQSEQPGSHGLSLL